MTTSANRLTVMMVMGIQGGKDGGRPSGPEAHQEADNHRLDGTVGNVPGESGHSHMHSLLRIGGAGQLSTLLHH